MLVILDNCAIDPLANAGANPVGDLLGTEFTLVYTPDLQTEYENALAHPSTSEPTKNIIREILNTGNIYGFLGLDGGPFLGLDRGIFAAPNQLQILSSPDVQGNKARLPRKRTDVHLAALAKNVVVITNNTKEGLWRRIPKGKGLVIRLEEFRVYWIREGNLASALRACIQKHDALP